MEGLLVLLEIVLDRLDYLLNTPVLVGMPLRSRPRPAAPGAG